MTLNLDDLEATAKAATPGPWIADPPSAWDTDDVGGYLLQAAVRVKDSGSITWDDHGGEVFKPADAEHIAAFDPPTVLALIARLREAEAVIEAARESEARTMVIAWGRKPTHEDSSQTWRILTAYKPTKHGGRA